MKAAPPKQRRLATALRENLRRRKAQARARASGEGAGPAAGTVGPSQAPAVDRVEAADGVLASAGVEEGGARSGHAAAQPWAGPIRARDVAATSAAEPAAAGEDDDDVTWRVRLVAAELEAERIAALVERAVEADGLPVTRYELPSAVPPAANDARPDGFAGAGADEAAARGRPSAARSSASVAVAARAGAPAWSARLAGDEELPWAVEVLVFGGSAEAARRRIADAVGGDGFGAAITVERVAEEDWVAKSLEGLAAVREGRFVIRGRHHRDEAAAPASVVLEIDAGLAFGTGHHATTVGCLAAIARLLKRRRPRRPLDLGTGTGVLAIALARLARVAVLATDIDPVAVRVATANVRANAVGSLVRPLLADGMAGRALARGGFDLVVANILARPLERLAPAIGRALAPDAAVVLSGLRVADGRRIEAAYRRQNLRVVHRDARDGWLTLTLARRGRDG